MELKNYFASDAQGAVIAGATCYVYLPDTTTVISGLVDISGNALSNPFLSKSNGLVQFAAPNGVYDLRVVKNSRDYTIRIQCNDIAGVMEDIDEAVAAAQAAAAQALADTLPFLGPHDTAPTTRNNGSALVAGDRYYDTVVDFEYLYTGALWVANNINGTTLGAPDGATLVGAVQPDTTNGTVQGAIDQLKTLVTTLKADLADPADGKGVAMVAGAQRTVAGYAAVRAYTGNALTLSVSGRVNILDRAGGIFARDVADTTSVDNDVTILVDVLGRVWKRQYSGYIDVRWGGAKCDAVTDDTAAVQKVVNVCASFPRWAPMGVTGRCLLLGSLMIDRLVDTTLSDWFLYGIGPGAGFYATGAVKFFDSAIATTIDPRVESIKLVNMHLESSSIFNAAWTFSEKFLRVVTINCSWRLIRYISSTIYIQTHYFISPNIRNVPSSFIDCAGSYDTVIDDACIENNFTIFRCIDAARGTNGLRVTTSVIEGGQAATIIATGLNAFVYDGNHVESQVAEDLNLWGGTLRNKTINIDRNYIFNPLGAAVYHGPTDQVSSKGNAATGMLHENVAQVASWTSIGDVASPVADIAAASSFGGILTKGILGLSTPSGTAQTGRVYQGSGAPSGAAGAVGDIYFRYDTPTVANQRIYTKTAAGAWTGIL